MQIIYISNRPEILKSTIIYIENLMTFIDEILIICPRNLENSYKFKSRIKTKIIIEEEILREEHNDFLKSWHVKKNWKLRSKLPFLREVKEEFIMSDDDFRPLFKIDKKLFIENKKYNSYYFYNLDSWFLKNTDYDLAQKNMSKILRKKTLPKLAFSSHMPQIYNKNIFKEVVNEFKNIGESTSIDEWSTYFNYGLKNYPDKFSKPKIFVTLGWPNHPYDWPYHYRPKIFLFENFYEENYASNGIFNDLSKEFSPDYKKISLEKIKRMKKLFHKKRFISKTRFYLLKLKQKLTN